jgi:hypothetical protein
MSVCLGALVACGGEDAALFDTSWMGEPPDVNASGAAAVGGQPGSEAPIGSAGTVGPSIQTPGTPSPLESEPGDEGSPEVGELDTSDVPGAAGGSPSADAIVEDAEPTEASLRANGPYQVQSYASGFSIGPDFPGGTVWYPENGSPPYASIAIVPGFVSPRILIEAWGPFLASHEIVTFTIDTNLVTDQPEQRSRALLNALESLAAENTRSGSPLAGKLDTQRQAIGGWSMGGGGTLIASERTPELKAAIAMCSWSPGRRFSSGRVPTLLFASAGDPLAGGQSQGFYRSIPESTPKMLFEWGLGDHLMANAPTGATGQVGRFGLSWLKVFLEGDERYRPFLETECDGCTDFQTNL